MGRPGPGTQDGLVRVQSGELTQSPLTSGNAGQRFFCGVDVGNAGAPTFDHRTGRPGLSLRHNPKFAAGRQWAHYDPRIVHYHYKVLTSGTASQGLLCALSWASGWARGCRQTPAMDDWSQPVDPACVPGPDLRGPGARSSDAAIQPGRRRQMTAGLELP